VKFKFKEIYGTLAVSGFLNVISAAMPSSKFREPLNIADYWSFSESSICKGSKSILHSILVSPGFFNTSNDNLPFRMEIFASIFSSPFLAFLSACTVYLNINISSGFCSKTKSSMSTISSPTKLALIVSVLTNFAHLVMFSARCYLCSSGVSVSQIASS
jgi:hypothetical protein